MLERLSVLESQNGIGPRHSRRIGRTLFHPCLNQLVKDRMLYM